MKLPDKIKFSGFQRIGLFQAVMQNSGATWPFSFTIDNPLGQDFRRPLPNHMGKMEKGGREVPLRSLWEE